MKFPTRHSGKKSTLAAALVVGVATAGLFAGGVIDPASAQSGRRICGNIWTATSKTDPSRLHVYVRFAKVALNTPGCIQVHNDLDKNTFGQDGYPSDADKVNADITEWHQNDFRETCEDFSVTYLFMPAGSDVCNELDLWEAAPWGKSPNQFSYWTGKATDWHGVT